MKNDKLSIGIVFLVLAFATGARAIGSEWDALPGGRLDPCGSRDSGGVVPEPGCPRICWERDCSACPCTYGYVEGLFLQRSNDSFDQPIFLQAVNDIPVNTVLSSSDLDFDFDPGMRVVLGRRLRCGWALEGAYLGLFDARESVFVLAPAKDPDEPDPTRFPEGLGSGTNVFADLSRSWVDYSSSLHSAELNLVSCRGFEGRCQQGKGDGDLKSDGCRDADCQLTVEWLAGFRYLRLSEQLHIYVEADREPTGDDPLATESGYYDIRSGNNLYGPQLGARVRRWGERWGWEATGKAGIFGNEVYQRQSVIDWDNGPFERRSAAKASGCVAFVGDLNLTGIYRLSEVWNLRAGYNVLWIAGVALAPDQLDFSGEVPSGQQLRRNGDVFLHGVSCGLEARW